MARILPDVSRGFGPIVPQRQRFMMKKQSDEDKALKIMQAISGGVGTAAQLYKVGSDIYDRYIKETPEEALRRRQEELGDAEARQNIARSVLGGGMVGDQYDPMLGSRVPDLSGFAQARGEFAQDFADVRARVDEADKAVPKLSQLPKPPVTDMQAYESGYLPPNLRPEAAPAPTPTGLPEDKVIASRGELLRLGPEYGITPEMFRRGLPAQAIATRDTYYGFLKKLRDAGLDVPDPQAQPAAAQAPSAVLEPGQVVDPVISRYEQALQRVLTAGGKPELVDYLAKTSKKVAAEKGRPDLVPQMDAVTAKYKESLTPRAQATFDYVQRPKQQQFLREPRTVQEFVMGREGGREFSIRELNMAYNSLWRQGRQQEAEDLVRLAGAAKDIGQFVQSGTDSPVLVRARAEEAVAKMAKGGADRLSSAQAISLARLKGSRRGSSKSRGGRTGATKPKGSPKDPTAEERQSKEFLIVAAERGIQQARNLYYNSKTKKVTDVTQQKIINAARTILKEVKKERFKTSPAYELVRQQFGQDFYETAATEKVVLEEASAAEQALSEAIGLAIEDFGDKMKAADSRIAEMEKRRDKLPKSSDPQPGDYTLPETAKSLNEFKMLAPDDVKSQTAEIRKRKAAQVKERKSLDAKITRAKNALRTLKGK